MTSVRNSSVTQNRTVPEGTPLGLPRTVQSLCPECLKVIEAHLYEQDGKVLMSKECPEHGTFKDIISTDAGIFLRLEEFSLRAQDPLTKTTLDAVGDCPKGCGICAGHQSNASLSNLDLTNRCNLRCPFCFANANVQSYVYEPNLEQLAEMMNRALEIRPKRLQAIQFSGGEPTLAPLFLDACRMAKERGFKMIQVATNGIRFAREEGFAEKAAEAGLNAAYLQFDGVTDDVYEKTRGVKGLWKVKQKAIEAFRRAGIRVTLVPTMVKGVNDHQLGDIMRYAIENLDVVVGVAPQPVSFTGRIDQSQRMAMRYTSADVALDIEKQCGLLDAHEDWYPFNITVPLGELTSSILGEDSNGFLPMFCNSHPDCGLSAYLLVNTTTGETVALNQVLDTENMLKDLLKLNEKMRKKPSRLYATTKLLAILRKHFRSDKAPSSLSLIKLIKSIDAMSGKRLLGLAKKKRYEWRMLLMASMHFMDSYNYQVDRVQRCTIHYSAPNGRIYPFCTYNSGPVFREMVEKEYSVPKEEWLKNRGGRYVTEGFME